MKRFGILLPILLLSITWQTGTNAVVGAREASPTTAFISHNALAQSVSGAWIIEDMSTYGAFTSIAVDSNNLVHVSYAKDGNLIYARQYRLGDNIWWDTQTVVTTGNVRDTSLALDEDDRPYIAYYDLMTGNLSWAWSPTGGDWYTDAMNTTANDGLHPSAVMRAGILHVAYLNITTKNVEYLSVIPGGIWPPTVQTVGGPATFHADISLALRSDGLPRISYVSESDFKLMYAHYTGSAWTQEVVDGDAEHLMGYCNSLALNASNYPRIAYFDATNQDLRHISYLMFGWGEPVIVDDNMGSTCNISLALDGEGYSHILYHEGGTSGSLRYVRQQSGSGWSFETVDGSDSNCGVDIALALDSLGRPHAIYSCNGQLKYAYRGAFQVFLPAVMRGQ